MKMKIEQVGLGPADTGMIRACFEVSLAAERVDEPAGPWFTERPFTGWLTVGWDGNPREAWLATDQGSAVGWYRLELPVRENADQAHLNIFVHPAGRRRGLGRALLQHAAGRAAAHGRTVLNGDARDGSPGEAFARVAGAKPGQVEVQRILDIGKLEKGKLARLRGPAERAAAGYSLVSWVGPVPEEYIEQAAAVYNGMADAPRDPEINHEAWDAQRVRERVNGLRPQYGMRDYAVAARHEDTGELAGVDRGVGGSGRPRLGLPGVHSGAHGAPRAPARAAAEDRDDGTARDYGAPAGTDHDLERPEQRAHDRGQRGDGLHRVRPTSHGVPARRGGRARLACLGPGLIGPGPSRVRV